MRYSDLIQFEPIESVIQLLDANRPDEGRKLVSTYVISDDMAERIVKIMIPQMSFDESVHESKFRTIAMVNSELCGAREFLRVIARKMDLPK